MRQEHAREGAANAATLDPAREVDDVRRLVAEREFDLATIRAIRLLSSESLVNPVPGSSAAHTRVALLNDLAVLRYRARDLRAARACLREALALAPGDELTRDNLADLEAVAPNSAPPAPGAHSEHTGGPRNLNPWVREALDVLHELAGLPGKRVLEIGGTIPPEAARDLGVAQWTACDPNIEDDRPDERYEMRRGRAEELPFEDASFDLVFSSCAFEHLPDLDGALNEARRVLVPGGAVFSQFAPIWSCAIGHHLWFEDPDHGRLGFNDPVVPHWAHLLLSEEELHAFLERSLGPRAATTAVQGIYRADNMNRLFDADFRRAFAQCGLRTTIAQPWGDSVLPGPAMNRALETAHPGRGRFDLGGYRILLTKDA